jgi:hypothetical protein
LPRHRNGNAATVVAKIERSRSATVWVIGGFVLAFTSELFLLNTDERVVPRVDRKDADAAAQHRIASIIFKEETKDCRLKLFDNQTGRFPDAHAPCPEAIAADDAQDSKMQGTLHTIDTISKSFRSP